LTLLRGSNNKAREKLAWKPQVKFKELVKIMMDHEQNAYSDDRKYMESLDK
jgi:GDP-D-mannose dehydratase